MLVGTPPQELDFVLDLEEEWTWVAFDNCNGCKTEYYFKKADSTSFTDLHSIIEFDRDD